MSVLATTRLSTKGQVVLPEQIRDKLGLHSGDQFVVMAEKDVVILKIIQKPTIADFDSLLGRVRKEARRVGLKKRDIKAAIKKARAK